MADFGTPAYLADKARHLRSLSLPANATLEDIEEKEELLTNRIRARLQDTSLSTPQRDALADQITQVSRAVRFLKKDDLLTRQEQAENVRTAAEEKKKADENFVRDWKTLLWTGGALTVLLAAGIGIWCFNDQTNETNQRVLDNEAKEVRARLVNQDKAIAGDILSRMKQTAASITLEDLKSASAKFEATKLKGTREDSFGLGKENMDHPSPAFKEERSSVTFDQLNKNLKDSKPETNRVGVFYSAFPTELSSDEKHELEQKGAKGDYQAFTLRIAETVKGLYDKKGITTFDKEDAFTRKSGKTVTLWDAQRRRNEYHFDLYAKEVKVVFAGPNKYILHEDAPVTVEGTPVKAPTFNNAAKPEDKKATGTPYSNIQGKALNAAPIKPGAQSSGTTTDSGTRFVQTGKKEKVQLNFK